MGRVHGVNIVKNLAIRGAGCISMGTTLIESGSCQKENGKQNQERNEVQRLLHGCDWPF
jgi:hypothetical protein